jgi:nicotinamide riboside transporter PnuC
MQFVEILSALLGMVGALLLATRSRYAGWAFVAWLISNIGWIVFGAGNQHWFFMLQQAVFTATSVIGIWTWLVRPQQRQTGQITPEQEQRIRTVIEQSLDTDFVALVQTPHVLHTTAPVTYDCLRHILLWGMQEGIAMEREGGAKA